MGQYLFLLLVLACPLMMFFMMRGGHGHGHGAGHDADSHAGHAGCGHGGQDKPATVDDLRRQRDELDRQISEREWQTDTSGDRSPQHV